MAAARRRPLTAGTVSSERWLTGILNLGDRFPAASSHQRVFGLSTTFPRRCIAPVRWPVPGGCCSGKVGLSLWRWRLGRAHGPRQLRQVNPGGGSKSYAHTMRRFREMIACLSGRVNPAVESRAMYSLVSAGNDATALLPTATASLAGGCATPACFVALSRFVVANGWRLKSRPPSVSARTSLSALPTSFACWPARSAQQIWLVPAPRCAAPGTPTGNRNAASRKV